MEMDFDNVIADMIEESIKTKKALLTPEMLGTISTLAGRMVQAYRAKKKVIWFGNGGSAADAQHLAAELVSKFYLDRHSLPSLALNVNTSILTATGNDYGYDTVFAKQIEGLCFEGDIAVGISTSGNSPNVIEAVRKAREKGALTVAMTGEGGGRLKDEVDLLVAIPSKDTPRIQEAHITIGHILCYLVENELFGKGQKD